MSQTLHLPAPALIVPPLTPFDAKLQVDLKALQSGVDAVIEQCRPELLIAAGVEAQEYQFLSYPERLDLIRATIDTTCGRVPVAVGISHPSFRIAVELAHFAERHGAKAVQLLAPNRPTGGAASTGELVRYFELVERETSLPILLYLNAGPGADLSIPATVELSKLDCIRWVKESSRDLSRIARLITEIDHAGHAGYFTTMQMLLITLQLGGSGITLPPPAAGIARKVVDAYQTGDLARATELQKIFSLYPSRWMSYGLAAVMKASADFLGVETGLPYPPYEPVQGEALKELQAYLSTHFKTERALTHA